MWPLEKMGKNGTRANLMGVGIESISVVKLTCIYLLYVSTNLDKSPLI